MTEGNAIRRCQVELMNLLAHDIKNPIGTALANLGFAEESPLEDPEVRAALLDASTAVRSILRIVDDITLASRYEASEPIARKQPTAAAPIVKSALHALALRGHAKPIAFPCSDDLRVDMDPVLMQRAVEALVEALVRFSPQGAVYASIRGNERRVSFVVGTDTALFAKDARLLALDELGSAAEPASLGLGLYFARCVAEAHAGTLAVQKSGDGGTELLLSIPTGATSTSV